MTQTRASSRTPHHIAWTLKAPKLELECTATTSATDRICGSLNDLRRLVYRRDSANLAADINAAFLDGIIEAVAVQVYVGPDLISEWAAVLVEHCLSFGARHSSLSGTQLEGIRWRVVARVNPDAPAEIREHRFAEIGWPLAQPLHLPQGVAPRMWCAASCDVVDPHSTPPRCLYLRYDLLVNPKYAEIVSLSAGSVPITRAAKIR